MRKKYLVISFISLVLLSLAAAGYFAYRAQSLKPLSETEETDQLVREIGAKADLPEGETPTLATVTNRDRLDDQVFFRDARNGDKILIYPRSGEAILYRPSTGKILGMTEIDIEKWSAGGSGEASTSETEPTRPAPVSLTVSLYNGADDKTALESADNTIASEFPTLSVDRRQMAVKQDYTGTTVIDLTRKNADFAAFLAEALGGTIALEIPEGEAAPDTDFLVIVGKRQ